MTKKCNLREAAPNNLCAGKSGKLLLPDVRLFKAEMHQIRFRLGLGCRLRWGSLQCSPRPSGWIEGSYF